MATWANFIRTTKGLALDAKLTGGTTPLVITKAMSASGKVNAMLLKEQTALTDPVQTLTLLDKQSTSDATEFILPVKLSNDGVSTKYNMFQLGIFAQDPDEGEILYMICQTSTEAGEEIPKEADQPGFSIQWNLKIKIADASNVEITVSEVGLLTQDQADALYASKTDLKTVSDSLASLEDEVAAAESVMVEATLEAASWTDDGTYTWENENILRATQPVELLPAKTITAEQLKAIQQANIVDTAQAVGSITMTALGTVPTIDVPVRFIIRGDM